MEVVYDKAFLKAAKKLPESVLQQLSELLVLLQANPFHPLLHTKYLKGRLAGLMSFRVTRDFRVIFSFRDNSVYLLEIGDRKDVYSKT